VIAKAIKPAQKKIWFFVNTPKSLDAIISSVLYYSVTPDLHLNRRVEEVVYKLRNRHLFQPIRNRVMVTTPYWFVATGLRLNSFAILFNSL
jgi:hypothetical protein